MLFIVAPSMFFATHRPKKLWITEKELGCLPYGNLAKFFLLVLIADRLKWHLKLSPRLLDCLIPGQNGF